MATTSGGRRAGSRRGVRPKRRFRPAVLYYVLGILASLIVWGILVKTAVGFGGDARDGDSGAWIKLLIAALAAIAFMFLGFMLIGRLWRALTGEPEHPEPLPAAPVGDAYVEDQGFYDPSSGYDQTDQYSPYENPYADPYGADTPEPFGPEGGKRPSYGVGNNRLPRRQSPPAYGQPSGPPPAGPPPALPPGGSQGSGRYDSYQDPSDAYAPPPSYGEQSGYDTGTYNTGSYDTGGYQTGAYDAPDPRTGSYDTGAFRTGEYRTGAYDISPQTGGYGSVDYPTGAYDTGYGYNPAPQTDAGAGGSTPYAGPATQSMPSLPPRGTPSLPAPRATNDNPDDDWPEPPRRRH